MKYYLVVAHPDDETLGAGGSMYKWTREGHTVDVCIMCTEVKARAFRTEDNELDEDKNDSNKFLGVNKIYEGTFPYIEMNTMPHLRLVQFIEQAIRESEPDVIITHTTQLIQTTITCRPLWLVRRQFVCSNVSHLQSQSRSSGTWRWVRQATGM